jgi:hypothetical protein
MRLYNLSGREGGVSPNKLDPKDFIVLELKEKG